MEIPFKKEGKPKEGHLSFSYRLELPKKQEQ